MSLYEPVDHWRMPADLLANSIEEMAPDGRHGCEGIVLWLGRVEAGTATVHHLVGLAGPQVVKRPDQLRISPDLMNEVAEFAEARDEMLVGQIHSHPGTYVDLSPTDLHYGISAPHFLSVVAPFYAQDPSIGWTDCGVHVYMPREGFRRFPDGEIRRRIQPLEGLKASLTRLGA